MKRAKRSADGRRIPAFALCLTLAFPATAAQALIVVNQPWVRPAAAGQSTEVYMNLTSTDGATLLAARTDSAAAVTLRRPGSNAQSAAELALPARTTVELAPGKYRFWLRRLTRTVNLGDVVALTLTIQGADGVRLDVAVQAVARLRSPADDERRAHRHRH
ncbi:MAG: copper chaperone PCu(A)C [Betaproteobacteria bacterium]